MLLYTAVLALTRLTGNDICELRSYQDMEHFVIILNEWAEQAKHCYLLHHMGLLGHCNNEDN